MSELYGELNVFLDRLHVGNPYGFHFSLVVPTGRFPVLVERVDGEIGRATIIFDAEGAAESFDDELYEPLEDIVIEEQLLLAGSAARAVWDRERPKVARSTIVDPTGANVVGVEVDGFAPAEIGWWYGGDSDADHEGICALDIIWNPDLDPIDPNSPVRNMAAVIQNFFNEHGPPSLRQEEE